MSSREVATTAATNADPRQRVQRLEHPNADLLTNVDSDKGTGQLEPIVRITTEKNILDPGASHFIASIEKDQPLDDPLPEDIPIPAQETEPVAVAAPATPDAGTDPPVDVPPQTSPIVRNLLGQQEGKQLNKLLYLGANVLSKESANWGQHKETENIQQLL